jgi:8-oxo-dGTP diphosphatase
VTIYLVRHAKAGSRRNWSGNDALRPVSKPGHRQAVALATELGASGVTRILSSPFVRCMQTVEPLAAALGIAIDQTDALAEGAPIANAVELLDKAIDDNVVFCSHGDVIGDVLMHLTDHGVRLDDFRIEKGSVWVLECADGRVVEARYHPPGDG